MTQPNPKYLRRDDAAAYIRQRHHISCTAGYLAKLASAGGGPVFHRLHGRWALYAEVDLDAWALSRISGPLRKASDVPDAHAGGSDATGVDDHPVAETRLRASSKDPGPIEHEGDACQETEQSAPPVKPAPAPAAMSVAT